MLNTSLSFYDSKKLIKISFAFTLRDELPLHSSTHPTLTRPLSTLIHSFLLLTLALTTHLPTPNLYSDAADPHSRTHPLPTLTLSVPTLTHSVLDIQLPATDPHFPVLNRNSPVPDLQSLAFDPTRLIQTIIYLLPAITHSIPTLTHPLPTFTRWDPDPHSPTSDLHSPQSRPSLTRNVHSLNFQNAEGAIKDFIVYVLQRKALTG